MRCIDFEAHYYPEEFVSELCQRREMPRIDLEKDIIYYTGTDGYVQWQLLAGQGGRELMDIGEYRIAEMDAAGTDVQVLSAAQGIEMLPPEIGISIAHTANRRVFQAMQKYPGRFQGMAALPLVDVKASLQELETCVREYGFIGVNLFSYLGNDNYPDDDKYEPVFALAEELGLFVYLHPAHAQIKRLHGVGPQLLSAALGFGLDTLITFGRLLAKGTFDRHPQLKILMGHFGEAIPFLYDRFNDHSKGSDATASTRGSGKNHHKFGYYVDNNLYVTSSGMTSVEAFQLTQSVLGIDKILFGSDYPMDRPHPRTKKYIESLPISKAYREKILFANAERLFKL